MFNKGGSRKGIRKRAASDEEDAAGGSAVVQKKKSAPVGPLAATTASKDKKDQSDLRFAFESARTAVPTIGHDNRALAGVDDDGIDGPAAPKGEGGAAGPAESADGKKLYTGTANYQKLVEQREQMDRKATAKGPIKAPTNVRITCRFDYQPDICKDYKETGYCTFGDSCKFMHDRGDYKSGWELDRDWDAKQEKAKMDALQAEMDEGKPKDDEDVDDGLPFACALCRGPFKNPVETRCLHYFCEGCALAHYNTSRRCFLCNEQTFGQFNTAHKLVALCVCVCVCVSVCVCVCVCTHSLTQACMHAYKREQVREREREHIHICTGGEAAATGAAKKGEGGGRQGGRGGCFAHACGSGWARHEQVWDEQRLVDSWEHVSGGQGNLTLGGCEGSVVAKSN